MKILIENAHIIPMTGKNEQISNGYVVIEDSLIKSMGAGQAPEGEYDKRIDANNYLMIPGFINTHTHAAMTLLRGYADDLPLMEWLENKIWPMEAKLNDEKIYWGTKLAIVEMIKSGTTTFVDMYFSMNHVAQAVEETGIRAVLSRGKIGVAPNAEIALEESIDFIKNWHKKADGRVTCMFGPHAPYTCPPEYLKRIVALAGDLDVGINIHVAETNSEIADIKNQCGATPVALLEEIGLFERDVLAAHCVHLTEDDMNILKKYNVGVAHNPESNMKLASGIAPVPEMLEKGITVALGTDGASSNNNLDMLQEMRSAAFLHKVNKMDTTIIPAYTALEMATLNGAKALKMNEEIGQIKVGMKADMILINNNSAHMTPQYDAVANIVYSAQASDVDTVIINGNIIMENRVLNNIDEDEIIKECRRIVKELQEV